MPIFDLLPGLNIKLIYPLLIAGMLAGSCSVIIRDMFRRGERKPGSSCIPEGIGGDCLPAAG